MFTPMGPVEHKKEWKPFFSPLAVVLDHLVSIDELLYKTLFLYGHETDF